MTVRHVAIATLTLLLASASHVGAQATPPSGSPPGPPTSPPPRPPTVAPPGNTAAAATVTLGVLQQQAMEADPRFAALRLQQMQSELRTSVLRTERLPAVMTTGLAQYQSDVPTAPLLPSGQRLFSPPKDTYDVNMRVDQRLIDPTLAPRLAAERAQLNENQARTRVSLFAVRQELNEAFFLAALLQERLGAVTAAMADLDARLEDTRARVQQGAALEADAAAVEATLLQRRQDEAELRIGRRAALQRVATLSGRSMSEDDRLAIPDLAAAIGRAREGMATSRDRPEYRQFDAARERLARQQDAVTAADKPRLTAFARAGYGRPGLNFISDQFQAYGVAGVQMQWRTWNWGATAAERGALALQQQIVEADEAAFHRSVARSVDTDLLTIERLQQTLDLDSRIVSLRESVLQTAAARYAENVLTATDYLARNTELLQARSARASHDVELAQARARVLTALGLEVQ